MEEIDHIQAIIERNKRVEADKAWEMSNTRRIFIAVITYGTATLFLWLIDNPAFYIHSLVPMGGYLLSTLSLPRLKRRWLKQNSL